MPDLHSSCTMSWVRTKLNFIYNQTPANVASLSAQPTAAMFISVWWPMPQKASTICALFALNL